MSVCGQVRTSETRVRRYTWAMLSLPGLTLTYGSPQREASASHSFVAPPAYSLSQAERHKLQGRLNDECIKRFVSKLNWKPHWGAALLLCFTVFMLHWAQLLTYSSLLLAIFPLQWKGTTIKALLIAELIMFPCEQILVWHQQVAPHLIRGRSVHRNLHALECIPITEASKRL